MSWDDIKDNAGRRPCSLMRLFVPRCKLRYGEGACPAVLGQDSAIKCHNTLATCPVPESYDPEETEARFSTAQQQIPPNERIIPTITKVDAAPRRLAPGKGLGEGAEARVTLLDHPWPDYWEDYYRDERDYDLSQGTYWGKFIARNPYYRGWRMQVLEGYIGPDGFSWDDFRAREYVIDKIEGPDSREQVTVVGTDVFRLLERERSVVPTPNTGELASEIDENATEFTLSPSGIGNEEYPSTFRCVIGNEGFDVSRSGDTCTISERGLYRGLSTHESEDRVQIVRTFRDQQVHEIARDLIEEGQSQLSSWIPFSEWATEANEYLPRLYEADITEPTGVNELLQELMESVPVLFWPDERERKIIMEAIKPPPGSRPTLDDKTHYLADSITKRERPKDRVDAALVYFGLLDPTEDQEDPANYSQGVYLTDPDTQARYGTQQLKTIYSRWISRFNKPAAQDQARLNIRQYKETPITIEFSIDARFALQVLTGGVFAALTRKIQGATGLPLPRDFRVIESHEAEPGHTMEVEAESFDFYPFGDDEDGNLVLISEDSSNLNLREVHDSIYATVDDEVRIVVEQGVTISSNSTGQPAADVGAWPSGTTVKLTLRSGATIVGRGGSGGAGGDANQVPPTDGANGGDGGPGLYARYAIELDNSGVILGSGGGGGGAAAMVITDLPGKWEYPGPGGGGGSGYLAGAGGSAGDYNSGNVQEVAEDGQNGSLQSGGDGGPSTFDGGYGENYAGDGGGPSQNGTAGGQLNEQGQDNVYVSSPGQGGQGGPAIDGDSYITVTNAGTITGDRIN